MHRFNVVIQVCVAAVLCYSSIITNAQTAAPNVPSTSSNGSYTVTWDHNPNWGLQEQYNGGVWTIAQAQYVGNSKSFSGKAGGTYTYRNYIAIGYPLYLTLFSNTAQIVVADSPPSTPTGFTVPANNANGSYSVSWNSVASATRYTLQRQTNGGGWVTLQDSSATSRSESGISNGTYGYRVRACNSAGCSGYTGTQSVVVDNPMQAPTVPSTSSTGNYTVSWSSNWGLLEQTNSGSWVNVQNQNISSSKTFSGKQNATYKYKSYLYIGYPIYANLESAVAQIVVTLPPPSNPPATFTVPSASSSGVYTVSWSSVSNTATYEFQEQVGSGGWTTVQNTSALSKAFSGKTNNNYSYRVRACNGSGCSGFSPIKSTSVLHIPGVPGAISGPASDIDGTYSISWGAATGSVTSYLLQEQVNGGSWNTIQNTAAQSRSFSSRPDASYNYRVQAVNASGGSNWTTVKTVNVARVPGIPGSVTASPAENANGNYSVSWQAPSGSISYFELQESNGGAWSTIYSGGALSHSLTGKTVGNYGYRVRACNQVGSFVSCSAFGDSNPVVVALVLLDSPSTSTGNYTVSWSGNFTGGSLWLQESINGGAWTTIYTGTNTSYSFSNKPSGEYSYRMLWYLCLPLGGGGCAELPIGNVENTSVVPVSPGAINLASTDTDGSYSISWGASSSSGVDRYKLQERTSGGSWSTIMDANALSHTASGRSDGVYEYRTQACNGTLCSAWTAVDSITVALAPGIPSSITVSPLTSSDGTLSINWGTSSGTVDHYEVQEQINSGSWTTEYSNTGLSHSVSGLSDGIYRYRVRACNTTGSFTACSSYRQASDATVQLTAGIADPIAPTLATAPGSNSSSDSIGTIAGQFRVNESGSATYAIPISVPNGTAGVTPQLSLSYSSQNGNGLLGQGWSLGGVSAITRCRQTLAQDSEAKAITWTEEDRFCLNGQRLILDTGSEYGAVGATYKTETDNFASITSVSGTLGHPDHFTVEAKDGSMRAYGNTSDSKKQAGSHVLTWSQNQFEDSVGNRIEFEYASSGSHRLVEVRYAFGASSSPGAIVELEYSDQRADEIKGYIAGFELSTTHQLTTIRVKNNGTEIRSYALSYADVSSRDNKTSQITNIQECRGSVCLPATQFTWADQAVGLNTLPAGTTSFSTASDRGLFNYMPADINGDGYMDLVWLEWDVDGQDTDHHLHYKLSDGLNLVNAQFTNNSTEISYNEDVNSETVKVNVIDYNLDGRQDVIVYNSRTGIWRVHLSTPQNDGSWRLSSTPINTTVTDPDATFLDINSDGLTDAVYMRGRNLYQQLLGVNASEAVDSDRRYHFSGETLLGALDTEEFGSLYLNYINTELVGNVDFNGDGINDLYLKGYERLDLGPSFPTLTLNTSAALLLNENGFTPYFIINDPEANTINPDLRRNLQGVDFNGDGLSDILYQRTDGTNTWYYRLNTGTGFDTQNALETHSKKPQIADYNQDGYPDIVWQDTTNNELRVQLWNGDGFDSSQTLRSISSENHAHLFFDSNGDGVVDYTRIENNTLYVYSSVSAHQPRNKITRITNGLGNKTDITYGTLAHSGRYSRIDVSTSQTCNTIELPFDPYGGWGGGTNTYCTTDSSDFYSALNGDWILPASSQTLGKDQPVLELTGPITVVTDVASDVPAATATPGSVDANSQSSISYYYGAAKVQASGRGMLGFQTVVTVDNQSGITTTSTYRQDFPFVGLPLSTEVRSAQGYLLSRATNEWQLKQWNSGNPDLPYQPFIAESIEESYALVNNGASAGGLLSTVTTQTTNDDYGNTTNVTVETKDGTGTVIHTQTVDNTYSSDGWEKAKGRLVQSQVTNTRGSESITRTSAFTYKQSGALKGLLASEIIEPNNSAFTVTTSYDYDAFGNRQKTTISGAGESDRVSEVFFDAAGRYITHSKNDFGQTTESIISRNEFGQATQVTDINGVITNKAYGSLGRLYFEASETGEFTQTYLSDCDSSCPSSGVYIAITTAAGGVQSEEVFDSLGRSIRTGTQQFDGSWGFVDTEYDALGRVLRKSNPHSGTALYWTEFEYDILGRVVRTDLPGITNPITVAYNDLTTVTTNPVGQTKTQINNVLGESVSVFDHNGGELRHQYDAVGNLRFATSLGSSTDPHSVVVEMRYDLLGRKTLLIDPDKGQWSYAYNRFGEVTVQTDGKGQTSAVTYDDLGRKVSRVDRFSNNSIESNTNWTYNNAVSGSALGLLVGVADNTSGYTQIYSYDGFGRLEETTTTLAVGDTHYEKITYDQFGRPFQVFDAAGDGNWQDSAIQNIYNSYGYLYEVVDAVRLANGQSRERYYTVSSMDLRGNVTEYVGGNGVSTFQTFDLATGRLTDLLSEFAPGIGDIQDITYSWDDIGNLLNRDDQSGSKNIEESFQYDALNRLTQTQVAGQSAKTVNYNSLGNITEKSDVGTYTYGQNNAGPHAVTSTSDGISYNYDANGNLTSDTAVGNLGGRTLTYSTFDKPTSIVKGSHTTAFEYAPDRSRFKRIDTSTAGTTVTRYLGDVEKITKPDGTQEIKRYLPGNALVTLYLDASSNLLDSQTQYLYKDHLGSMDVITDDTGVVLQQFSFDAWGQRRNAMSWQDLLASERLSFDHSITTRGFTSHEMLDEVALVHMNGRIYDPRLGRFLQADPFVQSASDTQSYNRYSYVRNNPLNATDPSGYFWEAFAWAFFSFVAGKISAGFDVPVISAIVNIAGCFYGYCAAASFGSTYGSTGDFGMALRSGVFAGLAQGAFGAIGEAFNGTGFWANGGWGHIATHAMAGGVLSVLEGGKFGHGFISAGIVKWAAPYIGKVNGWVVNGKSVAQALVAAALGGTVSEATGGKFANGAITGAFQNLFNQQSQKPPKNDCGRRNRQCLYNSLTTEQQESVQEAAEVWVAVVTAPIPLTKSSWLAKIGSWFGIGAKAGTSIVQNTARKQAALGVNKLLQHLSPAQRKAYLADPANGSRFLGTAVHRATAKALRKSHPGRFDYNETRAFDFIDTKTGQAIELTTVKGVATHLKRGADIVTYTLP